MPALRHITFGLAAIAWGSIPVWFYAADRIRHYLDPDFHTIALCGGLGMIVLGAFNILTAGEKSDCCHDHDHGDHDHSEPNFFVTLALMILPVVGALYWTQDHYSDAALRRKSLTSASSAAEAYFANLPPFSLEVLEKNTTKTGDGHYQLELTQLFWSAGDEEFMSVFDGLPVELEAQLMPEEEKFNTDGKRLRLFRIFMTCCAADAQVIGITAAFPDGPPKINKRPWVRLKGTVAYEKIDGRVHVILHTASHEKIAEPYQERRPGLPF
jgi:uncharacterized repeat protein (TIGR03943 family)